MTSKLLGNVRRRPVNSYQVYQRVTCSLEDYCKPNTPIFNSALLYRAKSIPDKKISFQNFSRATSQHKKWNITVRHHHAPVWEDYLLCHTLALFYFCGGLVGVHSSALSPAWSCIHHPEPSRPAPARSPRGSLCRVQSCPIRVNQFREDQFT